MVYRLKVSSHRAQVWWHTVTTCGTLLKTWVLWLHPRLITLSLQEADPVSNPF